MPRSNSAAAVSAVADVPASDGDRAHEPRNRRQRPRLGDEYRESELLQALEIGGVIAGLPGDDEVRLEAQHALEIDACRVADLRDRLARPPDNR